MTVKDIKFFRDELYNGKPLVVICDNEHNFFDNYPNHPFPVWDDVEERVLFLQSNQEDSGLSSSDYPFTISITEYEHIQCIKCLADRADTIEFLDKYKDKLGDDKYKCCLEMVSNVFKNRRPAPVRYSYDPDTKS